MIVNANSGRKQEKFRHRLRWQNACTSCLKKMLTKRVMFVILIARGISAVGSAQHWQCWGQGFESPMLHQKIQLERVGFFFICVRWTQHHLRATHATSFRAKREHHCRPAAQMNDVGALPQMKCFAMMWATPNDVALRANGIVTVRSSHRNVVNF